MTYQEAKNLKPGQRVEDKEFPNCIREIVKVEHCKSTRKIIFTCDNGAVYKHTEVNREVLCAGMGNRSINCTLLPVGFPMAEVWKLFDSDEWERYKV